MTAAEPPRRSSVLAFLLAIIPGLGQAYAGQRGRGLAVLLYVPTIIALALWRMNVGGVNYVGPAVQAPSPEQVRAAWGLGIFLIGSAVLVYAWSIWDAISSTHGRLLSIRGFLILATAAFFVVGWDVTQIDMQKALTRLGEIGPRLGQLAWPWDDAFVRGVEQTQAGVDIDVPCAATPPEAPPEVPGAPYLDVTPRCGEMAGPVGLDGKRDPPGTTLHIVGRGFRPNEIAAAWWRPPNTDEFRPRVAGTYFTVEADSSGSFTTDINIPNFTIPGGDNPNPISRGRLILRQEQAQGPLRPSANLMLAIEKMVETLFLALMATFFGGILALPLSFVAARNLMSGSALTLSIYSFVRGILNTVRSIDPLIWAVIAVTWVGLGPFAGTLALALHTIASLGKLYSEAIENIEQGPIEAIQATGANWLQVIVYAIIPQVIPPFVSFTVYRWDVNIRSSTIIGAVGGGGIGFLLIQWIRLSDYDSAGIAVWLIAIVVTVLDYVSSQVREQFV
jgi:phosphonate transport system permease protein